MKIGLLEYLDRTGKHVSSEFWDLCRDLKLSPEEWSCKIAA